MEMQIRIRHRGWLFSRMKRPISDQRSDVNFSLQLWVHFKDISLVNIFPRFCSNPTVLIGDLLKALNILFRYSIMIYTRYSLKVYPHKHKNQTCADYEYTLSSCNVSRRCECVSYLWGTKHEPGNFFSFRN